MSQDIENLSTSTSDSVDQFEKERFVAIEASRKLKRRLLIGALITVVLLVGAVSLLSLFDEKTDEKTGGVSAQKPSKPSSVIFATPDYDRTVDIRTDPSYLELNRTVRLKRGQYTVVITEDDLVSHSPAVGVLYELVETIIDGNADAHNALFSDLYFTENDGEPEKPFTMQRIYDIVITEIREQTVTNDGEEYTEYIYSLEYKINRNDGTYRVDIGHDASRPQYFMLTNRSGEVKIDRLVYVIN